MAEEVTVYQCPACGGPLHFAGASGRLECDYCDSSFEVADMEAQMKQKEEQAALAFEEPGDWDWSGLGGDWGADAGDMKAYGCPSCGAQLITDGTTAATGCPYCGNNAIVPGQFSGILKPDYVIPFKLDKEAAVSALKAHYKGKRFLPKSFTAGNHIQEIKGVYVPFWLFDGEADADITYDAMRTTTRCEGDEEVITTEHFRVRRAGSLAFAHVPVDASSKMPDAHMDSIEPFDYADLKPFSTAYLPGFLAEKYDVSAEESAKRADRRCSESVLTAMANTITDGYTSCIRREEHITLKRGRVQYALMPVWLLSTKWQGKDFLFAMNGQTGRLVGDLPMSWGSFWLSFAKIALPVAAVLAFMLFGM